MLAQVALAAVVILVTAPALVVAVPLAIAIDRRGWRRWPALLGDAGVVALAVALDGGDAYRGT